MGRPRTYVTFRERAATDHRVGPGDDVEGSMMTWKGAVMTRGHARRRAEVVASTARNQQDTAKLSS